MSKDKLKEQAKEGENSENVKSKIDEVRARGEEVANQRNALEGGLPSFIGGGKKSEYKSDGMHCMPDVLKVGKGVVTEFVKKNVSPMSK